MAALRTGRDLQALHAAAAAHLSPAGQVQVATALDVLATLEAQPGRCCGTELLDAARHLTGAKVLAERLYGVGPATALAMTCWLGGAGRFSSSRKAVRFAGLDITVYSSDSKRSPGRLSRQGPPVLRWAVYEAGKTHARASAPDHALLRAGQGPQGRQARRPLRGPQDPPPGLPHPDRARRRRAHRRLSPAIPVLMVAHRDAAGGRRAGAELHPMGHNRGQLPPVRCQPLPVLPRRARRTAYID